MRCVLVGVLLAVGGVWLAWLAGWLNRVELHETARPTTTELGLTFEPETGAWCVVAGGSVGGETVRVRWRIAWTGPRTELSRAAAGWVPVPTGVDVAAWVRAAVAAPA